MGLSASSIVISPPRSVNASAGQSGRYVASVVCAASAGVHLALVPEHYREAGWVLATAFTLSGLGLGAAGLVLRRPGVPPRRALLATVVLLGVAGCYVLSRTTGIPLLVPDPEGVDALGVLTTTAEVLAAALVGWPVLTRKEPR